MVTINSNANNDTLIEKRKTKGKPYGLFEACFTLFYICSSLLFFIVKRPMTTAEE